MGNAQSNNAATGTINNDVTGTVNNAATGTITKTTQNTYGQNTQTLVPFTINCPVGQSAVCSSNTKSYESIDKKQGFEGFTYTAGLGPTDGFKMPNWVLPMLYIAIIILIFAAIIAAIYLNNK